MIYQILVKKQDFCVKMTQKIQKVNKLRLSCMSLMIKNCKFLKIPIGKLPRVYCMYEKNRKNRLKMSEKLLIQPRVVGGVIFHYRGVKASVKSSRDITVAAWKKKLPVVTEE